MSNSEFDTALVTAAFHLAGEQGWRQVNVVAAAREGGLSLVEARERFPSRTAIILRFGRLADQAALLDAATDGSVRDRLFDLLMRRFDVMQTHRAGVRAVLRFAPCHPRTAMLLACASKRSMRWMLQAAGVTATGPRGEVQVRGLMAVWLWGMRTWDRDESDDLSGTMAAVDAAMGRADRVASWLQGQRSETQAASPVSEGGADLDTAVQPPTDPPQAEDPPLPESEA
jgi:ubiquinone biosynthesis protein COQ9